jgi:hypothetical protein
MQPAAPEIERKRRISKSIGRLPTPAPRFKNGKGDPRRSKPRGSAESGGAGTDDNNLEIGRAARKH